MAESRFWSYPVTDEEHPNPFPETYMVVDEGKGGVIAYVSGRDFADSLVVFLHASEESFTQWEEVPELAPDAYEEN